MRSILAGICAPLGGIGICLLLLAAPALGQSDSDINLKGAIDFHAHQAPDIIPRAMDALDEARLAKKMGMRGIVMKNHEESTSGIAYLVRKEVPGLDVFGGIVLNESVGGINLDAVKKMVGMTGGYGRVIWFPTKDAPTNRARQNGTAVPVFKDGKLLPASTAVLDFIAQHPDLVLETGHLVPAEGLMLVHEAHARGIKHIVVTHAMATGWTVPQMQEGAKDGAYMEFVYKSTQYPKARLSIADYAKAMREVGFKSCLLGTDYGEVWTPPLPLEPQGFLNFMVALHKAGVSVADVNLMAKTNPALALGLQP